MATNELAEQARQRLDERGWEPGVVDDPRAVLYDLEMHRVELELQNEQLRGTESELERSVKRYRSLYQLAPVALVTLDDDTMITECNARAEALLQRDGPTLTGTPLSACLRPEDARTFALHVRRVRERREPVEETCIFRRPSGRSFRARLTSTAIEGEGSDETWFIIALSDLELELAPVERLAREVVAHRQSRSQLDATRVHLEAIVETAVDAIITMNPDGVIEFVNPAAERMFGYENDILLGRNVASLLSLSPDEDLLGSGREVEATRHDGATFPVHVALARMDVEGQPKFAAIVRDLTQRKELEQQLVQAQRMEAIGTLASGVAHDFNNLLMGVNGCLELALRSVDEENPAREFLEEIRTSLKSGASITSHLQAFARRDESNQPPSNVDDVVLRVRNVFGPLLGEEITLTTELDADAKVRADAGRLEQVLLNLAINARDAMLHGGTLDIETRVVEHDSPVEFSGQSLPAGRYVSIRVSDTGHGIPAEDLTRIFEPFYTTKAVGRGTGLGLAMVFGTMQSLGGGVRVESVADVGTTFELLLPAYVPDHAEEQATISTDEYERVAPARCRVLVVEDDPLVAQAVQQQLTDRGHRPILASNVEGARTAAKQYGRRIDVVLTDSVLPDGFGSDVATAVMESLPEVDIIFMSAHDRDALLARERVYADREFIQKPFNSSDLQRAIVRTMGRRARLRESATFRDTRTMTVLVVEDHPTLREALSAVLADQGYDIIGEGSAARALTHRAEEIDLLISDVKLPDSTGPELAETLRETHPNLHTIYCSGFPRDAVIEDFGMPDDAEFFRKPFDFTVFIETIAGVAESVADERDQQGED